VPETSLLDFAPHRPKYALQMALKLLVARIVRTDYYVTLDADVIATGPVCAEALLPGGRAAYAAEPRSVHPHWWDGSAALLGLEPRAFPDARFGVTPAVLSTAGALTAVASVRQRLEEADAWLASWRAGSWWSEYTIYRLALDAHRLFDHLHALPPAPLLCYAVWFPDQLPWNGTAAFLEDDCVFSLVQSSVGAPVSAVAAEVAAELPCGAREGVCPSRR